MVRTGNSKKSCKAVLLTERKVLFLRVASPSIALILLISDGCMSTRILNPLLPLALLDEESVKEDPPLDEL